MYLAITITVCVVFTIYSIWLRTKKGKEFEQEYNDWKQNNDI